MHVTSFTTGGTGISHGAAIDVSNGYIVEFCGLSGAGKSTLALALANELVVRGLPVRSFPGKSLFHVNLSGKQQRYHALASLIRRPVRISRVFLTLSMAIHSGEKIYGDKRYKLRVLIKWLKRWAIYIDSVNTLRNTKQINILDRGVCTNLLSIITRVDINHLDPLGDALAAAGAFPDLVVAVAADPHVIAERRHKRGDQQKFWQSDRDYEYKKYLQVLDLTKRVLQTTGRKVIHVNSNHPDSISENAIRISNELLNTHEYGKNVNQQN